MMPQTNDPVSRKKLVCVEEHVCTVIRAPILTVQHACHVWW